MALIILRKYLTNILFQLYDLGKNIQWQIGQSMEKPCCKIKKFQTTKTIGLAKSSLRPIHSQICIIVKHDFFSDYQSMICLLVTFANCMLRRQYNQKSNELFCIEEKAKVCILSTSTITGQRSIMTNRGDRISYESRREIQH